MPSISSASRGSRNPRAANSTRAPTGLIVNDSDWLIVTSHHCDVACRSLEKEPFIEVLRAVVVEQRAPERLQEGGRNPRALQLMVDTGSATVVLACKVHDRWNMPRELLMGADTCDRYR